MQSFKIVILFLLCPFLIKADFLSDSPQEILAKMTLRQKIAQLIIAAAVSNEEKNHAFMAQSPYRMEKNHLEFLIKHCEIGGVIFLGDGIQSEQTARTKYFQKISKTPLFIAMDAEWGPSMRLNDGFRFPHNMTLGAIGNNDLIYQMGYTIGCQLQELGVHINLAPVMDVNNNQDNPVINSRSFGSDPNNVAQKGVAYLHGLQDAGIIACAKHFPGHGDTDIDSHNAMPTISHNRARLDMIELVPFKAAIKEGVKAVMTAHINVPELDPNNIPASLSSNITTNLLRHEMHFDGLIITDGLGMRGAAMHNAPGMLELQALQAGADILLCPMDVPQTITMIANAVTHGIITEAEIDQKVIRILTAKQWAISQQKEKMDERKQIAKQALQLKKQLYAQAITIAKDTIINKNDEIIVSMANINNMKKNQYGILDQNLEQLKKFREDGKQITVVIYGSPYAVELLKDYADRIIVAYEDEPESREAVAQILAGNTTAYGTLPV